MANSNGLITAPIGLGGDIYPVLGLASNGTYDVFTACGNTHGKINKMAKYKPYKFGGPGELTDGERIGNNYGMEPKAVDFSMDAWGQWKPPVAGEDWGRMTDFEGYYHQAGIHVLGVKMSSEADGKPVLWNPNATSTNRVSYYTASVRFAPALHQLLLSDFRYNNIDLANMRLTLWIGGSPSAGSFSTKWAAQSAEKLGEWVQAHPNGGVWSVSMRTTDLRSGSAGSKGDLLAAITSAGGNSLVMVGLAPEYSGFSAVKADPATPIVVDNTYNYLVSVYMYPEQDWLEYRQWERYSNPGYAFVGEHVGVFGAIRMFITLTGKITDADGYEQWVTMPASSAKKISDYTVRMGFADTIITHYPTNTPDLMKLPSGSKVKLTAHITLCERDMRETVVERKSIKSGYVEVDSSKVITFTPEAFTGSGEDKKYIDVTFSSPIGNRRIKLQYELDPQDAVIPDLAGNASTNAWIEPAGEYNGLSTAVQTIEPQS